MIRSPSDPREDVRHRTLLNDEEATRRSIHSGVTPRAGSRRPLPLAFFARDPGLVARSLLGSILECDSRDGRASGRIVEVEAYLGPRDPASHASRGHTARTVHLFGPPGTSYVYFIYGVHWCFNAVTSHAGAGMAVLVRAIEPLDGIALIRRRRWGRASSPKGRGDAPGRGRGDVEIDRELTNGPGKLCEALGITGDLSGLWLQRPPLTLRRGRELPDSDVRVSPRIGISKATAARQRYFVRDNPFVSRAPSHLKTAPYSPAKD